MKTEISWNFLALVTALLGAGTALMAWPQWGAYETFAFVLIGWIVSLCLHEYAHAATASAFGDHTIVARGYLTLDPIKYFNGPGTLVLPVIALVMGGIALPGGAVLIRNDLIPKPWQQSLVALAGPFATLVMGALFYLLAQQLSPEGDAAMLIDALMLLGFFQLMAFVLNILPVPGLDGYAALKPWLPQGMGQIVPEKVTGIMAVGLLILIFFFGYRIIFPIMHLITGLFGIDLEPVGRAFDRFHFW